MLIADLQIYRTEASYRDDPHFKLVNRCPYLGLIYLRAEVYSIAILRAAGTRSPSNFVTTIKGSLINLTKV